MGPNNSIYSVTTADVNCDGHVDLICANEANTLTVLTNNGNGSFALDTNLQGFAFPDSVCAADVNGDGKVDLIAANYSVGFTVLTNNGRGGFVLDTNILVGFHNAYVTAVDVNGDGYVDLIGASQGLSTNSSIMVFTNNGSGRFALATNIAMGGGGANWTAAADFNGDGKIDFASANRFSNTMSVFYNTSIFPPPASTPPLNINASGNGIQVSWPSVSRGWSLQQNSDLTTTNWGASGYNGYPIADNGTNKSLTFPFTVENLFFRLLHP